MSSVGDTGESHCSISIGGREIETHRTRTEMEAIDRERAEFYELAPIGYLTVDNMLHIIEGNESAARLLGIGKKELLESSVDRFVAKESTLPFIEHLRLARKEGTHAANLRIGGDEVQAFNAHLTTYANGVGDSLRYRMIVEDVTNCKRAEEKFQRGHKQLLSIFNSMDEVVYIADSDNHELLYENDAFQRSWGDGIGQKCYKVLQNRDRPCPFCTNDRIFGRHLGKTCIWEFQNEVTRKWFRCIDRAIEWPDGRMVRFEVAININGGRRARDTFQRQATADQRCESTSGKVIERSNSTLEQLSNKDIARLINNRQMAMLTLNKLPRSRQKEVIEILGRYKYKRSDCRDRSEKN